VRLGQSNFASCLEAGEHRLRRRVGEGYDAGLEAGLIEGGDDAVVVGGGELTREQEQGLVVKAAQRDWFRAREPVAMAHQRLGHFDATRVSRWLPTIAG
jgi:hypothetical protein